MTQVSEEQIAAVAFLCDVAGVVRQILYDGLGTGLINARQSLESALDPASAEKCRAFLNTVLTKGAAYGWEMNLTVEGRLRSLRFSANTVTDGIFVAAGVTTTSIVAIYERFMRVENTAGLSRPP